MPTPESSLLALIKLLGDDHAEVVEAARTKLVDLGTAAIPLLQETADQHAEAKIRLEARGVLERIRLVNVGQEWEKAVKLQKKSLDLESGAFLMARVHYPDLEPKNYQDDLDKMAQAVKPKLKRVTKTIDQLHLLNRYLFEEQNFKGDWNDYFNPQNSYLNRVMDRKLGIPISLSVLYLLLGQRLKLPVEGVGIPGHFMIKAEDRGAELYVDPFNEGRFLSRPECVQFIVEAGYPYQQEFLEGVSSREILARMLRNLILIYIDRKEETLGRTFTHFLDALYPGEGPEAMEGEFSG